MIPSLNKLLFFRSSFKFLILPMLFFLLLGCGFFDLGSEPNLATDYYLQGKKIQAMFTRPGYDQSSGTESGVHMRIAALIDSAHNSLDISIYELSEPTIYQSVLRAWERGVQVRFVGDIDNMNYEGYQAFMNAGIPMSIGNEEKIMHNKYIIVDERYLSMGSMNFTSSGVHHNNENVVFIDSPDLAAYYKKDFEVSFIQKLFGTDKIGHFFEGFNDNSFFITNHDSSITRVDAFVVPYVGYEGQDDGSRVDYRFMDYVNQAEQSIHFAIFAFTHPDIANAVISAANDRGVQVYGVFDKSWHTGNEYALHQRFLDASAYSDNIHIRYDGNENFIIGNELHGQKCHNKYMLIDAGTENGVVLTGSYNFSSAASYKGNDENFLAIHDLEISKAYRDNFFEMYSIGQSMTDIGGETASRWDVVISEIMWAGSTRNDGVHDEADKFIELQNTTTSDINISGWQLVGTTAVSKSYRILMNIMPENTIIAAGEKYVVTFSSNRAYEIESGHVDPWLYLHHPDDQDYVFLILRDSKLQTIDEVGQVNASPWAGEQGSVTSSMQRVGSRVDGLDSANWQNSTQTINIRPEYRLSTLATPGI